MNVLRTGQTPTLTSDHSDAFTFGPLAAPMKRYADRLKANPNELAVFLMEIIDPVPFDTFMKAMNDSGMAPYMPTKREHWFMPIDGIKVTTFPIVYSDWSTFLPKNVKCDRGHPGTPDYHSNTTLFAHDSNGQIGFEGFTKAFLNSDVTMLRRCVPEWGGDYPNFLQHDGFGLNGLHTVKIADCYNDPKYCQIPDLLPAK